MCCFFLWKRFVVFFCCLAFLKAGEIASLPSNEVWELLKDEVGGRLIQPVLPWESSINSENLTNPWYLEDQAGATQSTGMYNAWSSVASSYAVVAESSEDIVAAVNFCRKHGVRLVVKGTGHDYFGRSCAPDSLLIWTHNMREVTLHEEFRPVGSSESFPAISVKAGNRWLEVYRVATDANRYVQGGSCTSVGACGGFTLGGGYGNYSKRFGTGAGGVLEMEVITADGQVKIANKYQNADLFWALCGGGGCTFGVVSRMTLLTHPIPIVEGSVLGSIVAMTDDGYCELIRLYLEFVATALCNQYWGEGVTFLKGKNTLKLTTVFLDMSVDEAKHVWAPFLERLQSREKDFIVNVNFKTKPFKDKWSLSNTYKIVLDPLSSRDEKYFWWKDSSGEVGAYWGGYQGWGIPIEAMKGDRCEILAEAFFKASYKSDILFQLNKGLAGEHPEAALRDVETSINPATFTNAGYVIMGSCLQYNYIGVAGHEPDLALSRVQAEDIDIAMSFIKVAAPEGGSYFNEGYYHEKNWQKAFWGSNYPRLLSIKQKYDPGNLFQVHQGVGSEK